MHTHGSNFLQKLIFAIKLGLESIIGRMIFTFNLHIGDLEGSKYKRDVVDNTDFQKFDDCLRMVIDSSLEETEKLTKYLDDKHTMEDLYYGINISDSALMTCLIFERKEKHLHFIDGSAGGYTLAAMKMKSQINKDSSKSKKQPQK